MMTTHWNVRWRGPVLLLVLVTCSLHALSDAARACNVPVFRFALERWRADPYRVTIVHRGPLGETERELIRLLEGQQDEAVANIILDDIDVSKLDEGAAKELLAVLGEPQLPKLIARYPEKLGLELPVWSGPLSRETVDRLTDSPVRKELVRRLAEGQTAVWLVLECGDAEKDKLATALVEQELKKLEKELKLPELTDDPADRISAAAPLAIAFSLLRVPRGEAEGPLVEMLLRSESDLAGRSEPLVFPVFGRGRALLPLVGAGITAENIQQSAGFLVGACSCEVKELNPGFDLLLAANWDELLSQAGVPVSSAVVNEPGSSDAPELVPIPTGSRGTIGPMPSATSVQSTWIASGVRIPMMVVVVGGALVLVLAIACLIGWAAFRAGGSRA